MAKKILHLTLKKHWFNLIAQGIKTHEYREMKPYWIKRLVDISDTLPDKAKVFDEVYFKNGYSKDAPFMRVEFIKTVVSCIPQNDEPLGGEYHYCIVLGKVLEVKNWGVDCER